MPGLLRRARVRVVGSADGVLMAVEVATAHPAAVRVRRGLAVPLGIFAVTRVLDAVLLLWIGRSQLPPSSVGVAPYGPPTDTGRSYGDLIANWDGQWVRRIVEHGYPSELPSIHGVVQPNSWAFYPLYPALVRLVTLTGLPFGAAASVVSLGFGAAAMCLLYRMLAPTLGDFGAGMSVLALCVAPAALIWQTAYSTSLSLFLVLVVLWALRSRRYGAFMVAVLVLGLTRPIALPVAAVAAVHWVARYLRRDSEPFPEDDRVRAAGAVVVACLAFLVWPVVAAVGAHRRDAFFVTRAAWSHHAPGWPTWLWVTAKGGQPAMWVVVPLMLAVLLYVVTRPAAARWGLELRWWGWLYPLYLVGATRPTTSIFRYALLAIVPWWPFPEVGDHVVSRRDRVALVCLVTAVGVVLQFLWIRWCFVISPAAISYP